MARLKNLCGGRHLLMVSLMIGAAVSVGSCASSDAGEPSVGYVEPSWMAEFRQQKDDHQREWMSCLESQGIAGTSAGSDALHYEILSDGSVAVSTPVDDQGNTDPALLALANDASEVCAESVGTLRVLSELGDEAAYGRMLDTRACLINEGYDIPEAPSQEVWMESVSSGSSDSFNPYSVFIPTSSSYIAGVSFEELSRLNQVCPQTSGVIISASS